MYECLNQLCNETQVCIRCELQVSSSLSITVPDICAVCLTKRPLIHYEKVLFKICVECFKTIMANQ